MIEDFKAHFPIFTKYPNLAYLDNAATTQRPRQVIDRMTDFYSFENSNIHRGVYNLSNQATDHYEQVRQTAADFLGATNPDCIAFTKGTTESMNIIAKGFLDSQLSEGDNIVTTIMEHHANFIPWQMLAKGSGADLRVASLDEHGDLDYVALDKMLDQQTKLLTVNHISNTLGTINNIKKLIDLAHDKDIPVMIDAAQSAAYYSLDHALLKYDFLSFSGHKIFGPFGVGILFAAEKYHSQMSPYNYGGGIIREVAVDNTTFSKFPHNLDAGTPNVAGVIGLGAALTFTREYDRGAAQEHIHSLTAYAAEKISSISEVTIMGSPKHRSGIISFTVDQIHPHDVASFLNQDEIAVRAGMHCTQPLLTSLATPATVRASFSLYNSLEEIDRLVASLRELIKFWT